MEPDATPALRVSTIIDELDTVADYLNVAHRAQEWGDLDTASDKGTSRLLFDIFCSLPPKIMTTTIEVQSTETLNLETTLQTLCEQHGLSALGKSLVQQHCRTASIAACLGQLPDAICSTSSGESAPITPVSTIWEAPPTFWSA